MFKRVRLCQINTIHFVYRFRLQYGLCDSLHNSPTIKKVHFHSYRSDSLSARQLFMLRERKANSRATYRKVTI